MVAIQNYSWGQGEDLQISLVYKSGPIGGEVPVDLALYSLRMDIAGPDGKVLTVLNNASITDTDPNTTGDQTDTNYEVTMNEPDTGGILIELSRALTLPGGSFYRYIQTGVEDFQYDIFLRDSVGKQIKLIQGTISISKSITQWP